ncbi:hypothetical protein HK098_005047 [Nowakowskiella sp. JEL0407]|nr:hypothetical protein HK098_005047 [Nowakowskiella sp. JEL0407]
MNIECSKVFPGVYRFPIFDFIGLHALTLSVADSAFHSQILTRLIECPTLKELRCDFNSDSGNFALSELVLKSKSLEKLTLYGRCGNSPEVFGNVKSSKFVKSFEFDLSIVSHDKHEITEILRESTLLEEVTVIITEFTDFDLHDTILIPMRERTEASKLERVSLKISLENMLLCKFNSKDRSSVVAEVLGGCWNNNVITGIFKRWNEKDFMVDRLSLDQLSIAELREFEDWFRLKLGKGIKIGFKDGSQCLWLDEK